MTNLDPDSLHQEAKPKTLERLWLIEHFRVLPTDERYLRLSDDQVAVLLNYWLHASDEEAVKRLYWKDKQPQGPGDEELAALGYSAEQIKAIKADLNG